MSTRAPKPKPVRRPTTQAEIDAVVEEVRREAAEKYAGRFDPKAYAQNRYAQQKPKRKTTQVSENDTTWSPGF